MTILYENIKLLCKERKLFISELERILEFPKNTISDWRNKLPSGERLLIVSTYFDVSVDYLVGNTTNRLSHKNLYSMSAIKLIETSEQLNLSVREIEFIVSIMYLLRERKE